MDPEQQDVSQVSQSELYGDALNSALQTETNLESQVTDLNNQLQNLGPRPTDTDSFGNSGPAASGWDKQVAQIDSQLKSANNQLATSKRDTANIYLKIATDSTARARVQGQSAQWAAQAQSAQAAANVKNKQAALLDAYGASKDQATIDKLHADAQDAIQRAGLIGQQTATSATQATLNNARAVQINEMTPAMLQLDAQHSQAYAAAAVASTARAALYGAQTNKTQAQADYLVPAQADYYVQRGILTQAQADQLKTIGPVKVDELEAKLGLEKTRADLLRSQIGRQQVLPYTDKNEPTLSVFQPSTGDVTGVPNPSYVVPQTQAIKDYYSSIDYVQQQLAQGQIQPDEADQLMANLRTSLDAQTRGFTPEQYAQTQLNQANYGKSILSGMQTTGDTMADRLLGAAGKARGLGGMSFTPYANAIGMGGGDDAVKMAMNLMSQVKPVTDRMSALDAVSKYAGAKAVLGANGGQSAAPSTPDQGAPDQVDQAAQQQAMGGYQGAPNPNIFGSGGGNV